SSGQKTIEQVGLSLFPPGAAFPVHRGDGLQPGEYVLLTEDTAILPYLPDPLAVGVAAIAFDRAGNEILHIEAPFPGSWPELQPFRLRLSEGARDATFENGVLEVRLPQADELTVRLSSIFESADLETFALWDWATTRPAE